MNAADCQMKPCAPRAAEKHRHPLFAWIAAPAMLRGTFDRSERDMKAAARLLGMAAIAALAACAPKPAPAPPVVQEPPAPTPPPPPPAEMSADWRDQPLSAGDWRYQAAAGGSEARFEGPVASFALRCDRGRGQVLLSRAGVSAGGPLTVRTSHGARDLAAEAVMAAADPFLDAIVFSRGRFTVEAAGLPTLIVPAWPEPGKVVEDCRN
jgi:hypothetical protein